MIDRLCRWYAGQCDGKWEHAYRIRIETLDNPGWLVRVNLSGTTLENAELETVTVERAAYDWVHIKIEDSSFVGACGPSNLSEIIDFFIHFAEQNGEVQQYDDSGN